MQRTGTGHFSLLLSVFMVVSRQAIYEPYIAANFRKRPSVRLFTFRQMWRLVRDQVQEVDAELERGAVGTSRSRAAVSSSSTPE
jgi:hypothetical protein